MFFDDCERLEDVMFFTVKLVCKCICILDLAKNRDIWKSPTYNKINVMFVISLPIFQILYTFKLTSPWGFLIGNNDQLLVGSFKSLCAIILKSSGLI